jgi:hypothetical protein
MKWIVRFITVAILVVAIAIPFFIKNKGGQPMLSLPTVDDLTPSLPKDVPAVSGERVFYKWQDEHGSWNFGDERPPGVKNVIPVTVDINANVMQALPKAPPAQQPAAPGNFYPPAQGYAPPASSDDTLTLDRALNIVEDAHAVRKMMESRNQALDSRGAE